MYGNSISTIDRGNLQPIYEMVYNHYYNRKGFSEAEVEYTKKAVDKVRGQGGESWNAQCLGLGTLLFNESK